MALIDKIRALLAKSSENGCTEAEALAAADKARELMDRYQISIGEIGLKAEGIEKVFVARGHYKRMKLRDLLALNVARFCDCKCWKSNTELVFFGLRSDTDFATWLVESLENYISRAAKDYIFKTIFDGGAEPTWDEEKSFVIGVKGRINERLRAATAERRGQIGDSHALVLSKDRMVAEAFADLGISLKRAPKRSVSIRDNGAYAAGRTAGDGASFGRPVGGRVLMIGTRGK